MTARGTGVNPILETKTEKYIYSLLPRRDPVRREMERYAARHDVPIIGPACGRLLYQLARLIRAGRVFEMGSAIGYSTLWLAQAVGPKGEVFYTDGDPANARRAEEYFRRAGVRKRIQILVGDALDMLERTPGQFDLVFNDVNKTQYPAVFRLPCRAYEWEGSSSRTTFFGPDGRRAPPATRTLAPSKSSTASSTTRPISSPPSSRCATASPCARRFGTDRSLQPRNRLRARCIALAGRQPARRLHFGLKIFARDETPGHLPAAGVRSEKSLGGLLLRKIEKE